ncbi:Rne/Rng family ribonuclease [Tritonibacter scottomollicae]|uniref:Rne/Rng family ribonuclease n=1 Tax=Tritonibacter scottomollicae TaxID=483013 RepID=UPI003BAD242A
MAKKMLIDATHAEETRVVVVDGNKVEEFDFESENKRQLAGNIYLAKVTRVEPSLQAAFVDYGGNRHGFLAFSEIHPDYYQIPVADREALMEEERAYAEALRARDEEDDEPKPKKRSRSRSKTRAERSKTTDVVETREPAASNGEISGMETIDLTDEQVDLTDVPEATSPMETVAETPVEEPQQDTAATDASDDGDLASDVASAEDADDVEGDDAADDKSEDTSKSANAADKDDSIESVADDDDHEDIRPPRKPRPKRYKIQEVIKVRQVLLVQVVKEERGNKGAALTTYLSLAGRYCVLMPNTARGGGISRKITNAVDRKKLKEIAAELDVPKGAGLIVRTAGAKRTKAEIKRDYEYLQRMWEQIRELTLKSIAPAKIYEEGDLIKRSIRDLYNREIDEVLVEGERGYRIAKDFMKMIMPSHAKNVKNYQDQMPLFARYQVETYLGGMFNPTVQLKSGGYIVIGVTEALVAIDVNSGRATKEASIEDTALKTNLEAAEEVARQLRLRDLAGLIVIDFIDMDERKNNAAVEKRMKDKLKTDRARIQVGRISGFGLMEMSRQRLRPGMIEATTAPCPHCHGTGLIRSDDSMALSILRQIEEEGTRRRSREVLVKCPVDIANYLMNQKREHIAQIEARYGLSVRIEGDVTLVSPDFTLEKFKTASRAIPVVSSPVVSVDASIMDQIDAIEEPEEEVEVAPAPVEAEVESEARSEESEGEAKPKRKRRRRRRKKSGNGENGHESGENGSANGDTSEQAKEANTQDEANTTADPAADGEPEADAEPKKKRTRTRTRSRTRKKVEAEADQLVAADAPATAEADRAEAPAVATEVTPSVAAAPEVAAEVDAQDAPVAAAPATAPEPTPAPEPQKVPEPTASKVPTQEAPAEQATAPEVTSEAQPAPAAPQAEDAPVSAAPTVAETKPEPVAAQPEPAQSQKPKRRGWWSVGS